MFIKIMKVHKKMVSNCKRNEYPIMFTMKIKADKDNMATQFFMILNLMLIFLAKGDIVT